MTINFNLIPDEEMNIDWSRDADTAPPPPPDASYRATMDYEEADPEKRWETRFAVMVNGKNRDFLVTAITGTGKQAQVTVKEPAREEGAEDQYYDFTAGEGQLYLQTVVQFTLVGVFPDKKTLAVPHEDLWMNQKIRFIKVSTKLKKDKTTSMTDLLKSAYDIEDAQKATNAVTIKKMLDAIVVGQLPVYIATQWKGRTENYNRVADGEGFLEFSKVPAGMRNFPINEKSASGHDPVFEKQINGVTYEFRAIGDIRHFIPQRGVAELIELAKQVAENQQ